MPSESPTELEKFCKDHGVHEILYQDWPSNWVYKAHGKVLCKRFQRNLCTERTSQDPQPTPALDPPLVAGQEALADPEAIPFLKQSRAPLEQESRLMLQCLWSRSIIAIIASLPAVAPQEELAISLMQAIKASAAIAILTVPRDHSFLRSPELAACLHDAAFHMCPSPRHGEVILASTELPTWPCPDSELLALEALGRISKLPLRLRHITDISYASLLKTSGPFVAHRPPICDGAGAPSSADHSLPHASGISKASKAWVQWAQKSDLSHRVFASAKGQPFRLELMQALTKLIEDPDQDLPTVLAEGVHTGVFSEIKPSGLWPPAKLQPLSQSGLEVCQGNWRPAEEDPETVAALLADEEAAGWIKQVPGGGDYAYSPRSTQVIPASRAPISWKKASVGDSLIWCGWKFNFAYETVELCAAKRLLLTDLSRDAGFSICQSLMVLQGTANYIDFQALERLHFAPVDEVSAGGPGLKQVNGMRILEICAPYHQCIPCQMDCCGSPLCENPFAQENAPLQQLKKELPSYNFSFSAEWIGFGRNANWQHVLEIRPGMAVGQVVGIEAPAQGNM
ncbi:hypothetical protein AK812_SmicGene25767 [Symbiodinium microadriaticum]|uniref:Uncharacterized protein n=1 Tax=Symbiodinium microadriaticum TaxID=2951 RepID=A0A1Q9DBC1_SYMMI|nr:hypothetical protein AK812_SmicGene25767 [Symbiodinium microadriaticum]